MPKINIFLGQLGISINQKLTVVLMKLNTNFVIHLPANRILIKSNGCRMSVEVTPPDMPATMCSYLTCENNVTFRFGPLLFIADIFLFKLSYENISQCVNPNRIQFNSILRCYTKLVR